MQTPNMQISSPLPDSAKRPLRAFFSANIDIRAFPGLMTRAGDEV
jgi:hypothetical protein